MNYKDIVWVDWCVNCFNDFMGWMSWEFWALDSMLILFFFFSIYFWSKFEYLQDWLIWVKNGWVDEICLQVYCYDIEVYCLVFNVIVNEQVVLEYYYLFVFGILFKVGDYIVFNILFC